MTDSIARAPFVPTSKRNGTSWDGGDDPLWLLTPEEVDQVPDGFVLHGISGERFVMDEDGPDRDTRFGFIAWGFLESQLS
jgi:hypothetical protein